MNHFKNWEEAFEFIFKYFGIEFLSAQYGLKENEIVENMISVQYGSGNQIPETQREKYNEVASLIVERHQTIYLNPEDTKAGLKILATFEKENFDKIHISHEACNLPWMNFVLVYCGVKTEFTKKENEDDGILVVKYKIDINGKTFATGYFEDDWECKYWGSEMASGKENQSYAMLSLNTFEQDSKELVKHLGDYISDFNITYPLETPKSKGKAR